MPSWFGRSRQQNAAPAPSNTNASIHRLDDSCDTLQKREELLNRKIALEMKKARDFSKKGQKAQAMACLKRKKAYEAQVEKLYSHQSNLQTMRDRLEDAVTAREVLAAQQEGTRALQREFRNLDADRVTDDLDKIRDVMDDAREISDALATPLDGEVYDDDDLLNELNELEDLDIGNELKQVQPVQPKVENKRPVVEQTEEDAAMAELDALMAA
eukprot:NODE_1336_length_900_cov_45.642950_g1290_i0.p1 GENE.NODE_1336_length_900_cov_45.642950_g1290_i0~~NODE_1336_length_900_cov_45.642950_g1290_i0.p1  ORF type:complete len:214 (+),score=63.22 NODE_1336_length_900_cov_45.642950_g1290_i0:119-760(+)